MIVPCIRHFMGSVFLRAQAFTLTPPPEEDRKERRRKLGLPEELSEEEKKVEADRLEQQRKEDEAKKAFTFVKPVSGECMCVGLLGPIPIDEVWSARWCMERIKISMCTHRPDLSPRSHLCEGLAIEAILCVAPLLIPLSLLPHARDHPTVRPSVPVIDKVRRILVSMKKAAPEGEALDRFKTALGTLLKYLGNIAANPDEEKFR